MQLFPFIGTSHLFWTEIRIVGIICQFLLCSEYYPIKIQILETIELRGLFVNNFILYDEQTTALIDTGFLNGINHIEKALNKINRSIKDVDYILLTHGHFDHVAHLEKLKKISNATIVCTAAEQIHIDGKFPYKGISRVTQFLEALGRFVFNYSPILIDYQINHDEILDLFGGLKAIHLPGHSIGHIGYLHLDSKILFVGDFIDTRRRKVRFPPCIFNSFPELFPESIKKVDEMDLKGIISNHGPPLSSEEQLFRFKKFTKKYYKK